MERSGRTGLVAAVFLIGLALLIPICRYGTDVVVGLGRALTGGL